MDEASTGVQREGDHARYPQRRIECRYFARSTGGKKSLRAHFSGALAIPEIDGRGTIVVQEIPTRGGFVVLLNVLEIAAVGSEAVGRVWRRSRITKIPDNFTGLVKKHIRRKIKRN